MTPAIQIQATTLSTLIQILAKTLLLEFTVSEIVLRSTLQGYS